MNRFYREIEELLRDYQRLPGLVGLWLGDGRDVARSGYNPATRHGSVGTSRQGTVPKAVFSSALGQRLSAALANITGDVTVGIVVQTSDTPSHLIGRLSGEGASWALTAVGDLLNQSFAVAADEGSAVAFSYISLANEGYHSIVGRRDGGTLEVIGDGVAFPTNNLEGSIEDPSGAMLEIGGWEEEQTEPMSIALAFVCDQAVDNAMLAGLHQRTMQALRHHRVPANVCNQFDWYKPDNWPAFQICMQDTIDNADDDPETISTFGSLSSDTFKHSGCVLHPNGKIYAAARSATAHLVINPSAGTVTTFGGPFTAGSELWIGDCLAPNGYIYCAPFNATAVLKINPFTLETTTFGDFAGTGKWYGIISTPYGLYCIPTNATAVLKIDWRNDTTTLIGSISGSNKYGSGALAHNGKIYCAPYAATSVLVIDPRTDTTYTIGSLPSDGRKWLTLAVASSGMMYSAPSRYDGILKINPFTDTVSEFGDLERPPEIPDLYSGTITAPNGKIYAVPRDAHDILVIDPTDDSYSLITSGVSTDPVKYGGGVVAFDGCIYCPPGNATTVLKIDTGANAVFHPNVLLSGWLNKY